MTSFPTSFSRVPSLLFNQQQLTLLERTNFDIFRVSEQLTTGRAINRPSDDPVRASAISLLDARVERSAQVLRNLEYARGALDEADVALGGAMDIVNEALSIASAQIGSLSSSEEREGQAVIVDSLLDSLFRTANRESIVGSIFGGSSPGTSPFISAGNGAFQFVGQRGSLFTDIGPGRSIPVTLGADNAVGALSARVEGSTDLNPGLTLDTRIDDLDGSRGLGITLGTFRASFNGDTPFTIDIGSADTVGDAIDQINAAIRQYETDNGVSVLGPGGVSISGESITLDVPAGSLAFSDLANGVTAADLGLVFDPPAGFDAATTAGLATSPRLTFESPVSALAGLGSTLGSLTIKNNARTFTVDLSTAETIGDIKAALEAGGTGVRVEINEDGTGIDVVSEIAGSRVHALSIEEAGDLSGTASALGIRTLDRGTPLSVFNDGRGVEVLSGGTDENGNPAPEYDVDFTITLGDGFEIPINLDPSGLTTVDDLLAQVNTQADAALTAAGRPASDFTAGLTDNDNGITFFQDAALGGGSSVRPENNSKAADQRGLLEGTVGAGGARFVAEDRATTRPDNLFSWLSDLAVSLRTDDTFGIQLASEKLDEAAESLGLSRALVGGYAQRVQDETLREEDRQVLDVSTRSLLRDTDFAAAATELTLLETQLQAGLAATSRAQQLTLLDFLG